MLAYAIGAGRLGVAHGAHHRAVARVEDGGLDRARRGQRSVLGAVDREQRGECGGGDRREHRIGCGVDRGLDGDEGVRARGRIIVAIGGAFGEEDRFQRPSVALGGVVEREPRAGASRLHNRGSGHATARGQAEEPVAARALGPRARPVLRVRARPLDHVVVRAVLFQPPMDWDHGGTVAARLLEGPDATLVQMDRSLGLLLMGLAATGCGTRPAPERAMPAMENAECVSPCAVSPTAVSPTAGERCDPVYDPCNGTHVVCACATGATCVDGVCTPTRGTSLLEARDTRGTCDPVNICPAPRPAGGECGERSAGCPGVTVTCRCERGLACIDGRCGRPPQSSAGSGPCRADADHCCMPDGRLVRPGGCSSIYPSGVQPATRRAAGGTCEQVPCHLRCLPETAQIDTPNGAVPVSALREGDLVFTRDPTGARIARPLLRVNAVPVTEAHTMLELTLADGRIARASAGHPLARGSATLVEVAVGDRLDGAEVVLVRVLPYHGSHTWDLLPAGATGTYWADGVLIGSTLGP